MRILISDALVLAGVLFSKLGCEPGARRLVEWGIQVGLPELSVRFMWSGVDLAELDRQKKS